MPYRVLNHRTVTKAKITDRIYNRYEYDREKRDALELWETRLTAIIRGTAAEVVPLRRAQ
jgi:hypothetical protein